MTRLCLGTFLKSIIRCKVNSKTITQKTIVGRIMQIVDPEFDETDDSMISNIVRGKKNPSYYVKDNVNSLGEKDYIAYIAGFNNIIKFLDPNRIEELKQLICYIIENDNEIKNDTIVDLVDNSSKFEIRSNENSLENFLAGVFLYVLKYTDNIDKDDYVKAINEISLEIITNKKEESIPFSCAKENENTKLEDEDVFLEAQRFCLKYEDEMGLLPLCQIAYDVDPLHKDIRDMYTDYKLCKSLVRRKIMEMKGIPFLDFSNRSWQGKCIEKFDEQIHKDGLTTKEILYEGAKYFRRAYSRYSSKEVIDFNSCVFERPFKDNAFSEYMKGKCNHTFLETYINDFYWYKKNNPQYYVEPPMDYLWRLFNLDESPEYEVTYWVCKFIIASSYQMVEEGYPVDEKWRNIDISEELIRTQEDVYYYALLQLYWLYMIERTKKD